MDAWLYPNSRSLHQVRDEDDRCERFAQIDEDSLDEAKRRCGFDACITFVDHQGRLHSFSQDKKYWGRIATFAQSPFSEPVVDTNSCERPTKRTRVGDVAAKWGGMEDADHNLFSIFIPDGHDKTLWDMSPEELEEHRRQRRSSFRIFAEWLRDEFERGDPDDALKSA